MKNVYLMSAYTFREGLSRKIFLVFFGVSTLILLLFALLFSLVDIGQLTTGFSIKTNIDNPDIRGALGEVSNVIKMMIITPLYIGGLFLSIFSVSSFIPNLLEKGNIDLFLSKPVKRWEIIIGNYFGGVFIVFVNIAWLVGGIWLMLGLKFGAWDPKFLYTILTITFVFALIYSIIILTGILTRSSILAMMLSYIIFIILSPLLENKDKLQSLINNDFVDTLLDVFYYIIPQSSELGSITTRITAGVAIESYAPIYISVVYTILILGASIFIFNKKDY